MKRIFTLVLISFTLISFSQKAKKERFSYNYERLPIIKFDPETTKYTTKLVVNYEAEEQRKLDNYNRKLQNAKEEHQMALESWDGNGYQPSMRYVAKPRLKYLPQRATFNNLLQLDGFERGTGNAFNAVVTVVDYTFTYEDKQEAKTDSKGNRYTQYYRVSKYSMGVKYKVTDPSGKIVLEKKLPIAKQASFTSSRYKKRSDFNTYVKGNYASTKKSKLDEYFANIISDINYKWNFTYGYSEPSKTINTYKGKGKKHDYTDVDAALRDFHAALESLISDKEGAKEGLKKSIETYSKILKGAEPENKKAKISGAVANGLKVNKAYALIHLKEYSVANIFITSMESDKDAKKVKKDVENLREFLTDEMKRNKK